MMIRDRSSSIELELAEMGPRGTPAVGDVCLIVNVITLRNRVCFRIDIEPDTLPDLITELGSIARDG